MKALRARLDARSGEAGLSLVEVIIAMMVFAMIATGVGYTMLASLSLTKDSTARQQAANLASQEIDLTRSIDNLFNLVDKTTTTTINGITYTVQRTAEWVSDPNVEQRCGIGGGILRYKRVNVSVAWSGMTSTFPTVHADTLIDPGVRINDPDLGTILISVTDSGGNPVPGATVTVAPAVPANGAAALSAQPAVTDAQGCTYALMVDPGNYDVTVTKADSIDVQQKSSPSKPVSVDASSASSVEVSLDLGAKFPLEYRANYAGPVELPSNLDVSFLSTYGTALQSGPVSSTVLFPFPAGYEVIAGNYNDPITPAKFCNAVDPLQWPAGTTAAINYLAGVRPDAVAAIPGGTAATAMVPMGVVGVPIPTRSGYTKLYIRAVSEPAGPGGSGNPGCGIPMTYTFGQYSTGAANFDFTLPYGSWKFYATTNASGSNAVIIPVTNMHFHTPGQFTTSGNIVTLDPRKVTP